MSRVSLESTITTIIPTYRRPFLVQRAIHSALKQTYPYLQVCVYDNSSGDETKSIVSEIMRSDGRVRYHQHGENLGPYNNFNFGISNVTTPFFSLLSDDDVLTPTFYEQALKAFKLHPEAMFVGMSTMVVDSNLHVLSPPLSIKEMKSYRAGEAIKDIIKNVYPWTWTGIVFRREVRDGIGLINTTAGPHADGGYVCHAAAKFPNIILPGVAAILMTHKESTSGLSPPINKEWIKWSEIMVGTISDDEQIQSEVLADVRMLLRPDFLHIGFMQVGRALIRGDFRYAALAAEGVKDCGYRVSGRSLEILVKLSETSLAKLLIRLIQVLRRHWHTRKNRELDRKYGHLIQFLEQ